MSNETVPIPEQAAPAASPMWGGWRPDQLPPVVHELRTARGHRLAVRLIRPGQHFGRTATLNDTPIVEVRRTTRIGEATGDPGEILAVWDLTLFLEEPRSMWQVLTEGVGYGCTEDELCAMYAAIHDHGVSDAAH